MAKSSIPSTPDKSRFLKCLFCTNQFSLGERKPWFLKCCLNTVCSKCAQKLYVSDSGCVECPICRKKVTIQEAPLENANNGLNISSRSTSANEDVSVDEMQAEPHVNGTKTIPVIENGIHSATAPKSENGKQESPRQPRKTCNSRSRIPSSVSSRSSTGSKSPASSLDRLRKHRKSSIRNDSESDVTSVDVDDVELSLNSSYDNESCFSWSDTRSTISSVSASLPLDPIRVKTIEYNKVQRDNPIPCKECPLSHSSSWRCENCCLFLCNECQANHKRDVKTKRHTVVPFDVLKSRPIKLFNHNHFCEEHPFSRLTLFCCTCNVVICSTCTRNSHERKTHTVTTVQEAFSSRVKIASQLLADAKVKIKNISQRSSRLKQKNECSMVSIDCAEQMIISTFDALSDAIQQRKSELLSDLLESQSPDSFDDTEKIGSQLSLLNTASNYAKELRSKADCVEFLQQYSSVTDALRSLIEVENGDAEVSRKGVVFQEAYVALAHKLISSVGQLNSVTFRPTASSDKDEVTIKPFDNIPAPSIESSVTLTGDIFPKDANSCDLKCLPEDRVILLQTSDIIVKINCPCLHFDQATMFADRSVLADALMTNRPPEEPLPHTGCRLKSYPGALADRAVCGYAIINPSWPVSPRGKHMWVTKVTTSLKQKVPDNKMVFEAALTEKPLDARFSQRIGSSVVLAGCEQHHSLCVKVKYNGKVLAHIPSGKNKASEKGHFDMGYVLDLDNTSLHVFNMLSGQCIFSIHDIDVTKPLWPVFCVGRFTFADIKLRLVSGSSVSVPDGVCTILKSMYEDDKCSTLTFTVEEPSSVK
ncbi:uncharacterized protein LOC121368297 [Gigantopelta aegis]|uniref:uncharacterized protein LOC121368297 n=1 Tax=Gigantopelta aegis TaxID=1735272 RepID=UPI001B8890CD|nr:uncharacterized protein LOC121368297 [Gigantopelta aegis]